MTAVISAAPQSKLAPAANEHNADVYCPICTHTVPAHVGYVRTASGRKLPRVTSGQKCPRCSSPLDAAYVMRLRRAAA
jgi:hypothetical protein